MIILIASLVTMVIFFIAAYCIVYKEFKWNMYGYLLFAVTNMLWFAYHIAAGNYSIAIVWAFSLLAVAYIINDTNPLKRWMLCLLKF